MNKNIIKNSFFYFFARIVTLVFSFTSAILLGRYLGVTNYGIYGFAVSVGSIFVVFLKMGARDYITRQAINDKNRIVKFIANLYVLRIIILILLEFLLFGYILINKFDILTKFTLLIIVNTIYLNSFLVISYSLNRVNGKYNIEILNQIASSCITVIGYYFILVNNYGLKGIALWLLFLSIIQNIIIGKLSISLLNIKLKTLLKNISFKFSAKILKESLPFLLTTIFGIILFRIDAIMLRYFYSSKEVGYYLSSYKFVEIFTYFPDTLIYIFFPVMVKKTILNKNILFQYYKKIFKFLILLVIPIIIGVYFYSANIIMIVWGKKFIYSHHILKVLSFSTFFIFLNYLNGSTLITLKKEKLITIIAFVCALFNILTNLYFIPHYKEIGAAITTIASEGLYFILNFFIIGKYYSIKIMKIYDFIKIIFLIISFYLIMRFFKIDNFFIAVPIYAIVYGVLIFVFQVVNKDELKIIKRRGLNVT